MVEAVGHDRYDDKELPDKVTWSSGRLESKDKYSFQFGRMAVRAKVNDSKGIWPAIWMLAQDETGHDEIDVLEYLGQNPWYAWTTNHFGILAKIKNLMAQLIRITKLGVRNSMSTKSNGLQMSSNGILMENLFSNRPW